MLLIYGTKELNAAKGMKKKREKDHSYRFMQSSKVKGKVCQILPYDMPICYGNSLLEAVTSEKLFKDTNLHTVTYSVYRDCTVAKIQP